LKLAWTFRTGKPGSEAIPIVVDGVMYVTAPDGVCALVPETGELLWKFDAGPVALRGLTYWKGTGGLRSRVFAGNGRFLLALDVVTGKPAPGFGNEGRVDLKQGVGDLNDARYSLQSPPAVFGDIIITGCSNGEGSPSTGAYGDIRGWDAQTGKLEWTFHTVPRPREPGAETWPLGAWKNRSGTNVWGFFTTDVRRGVVYAPLGAPTSDFYGADRAGDGLYGNSLVALDARTGEKKWHRQLVHHDLWDYDLAAPPALLDIRRNGRVIPAVAQITKMGLLFVFDRVTGKPVYGIEERAVPQTNVPGGDGEDPAISAQASAARKKHLQLRRNIRPVAGACTLLQRAVRKQPNEDRPPLHALAARRKRTVLSEHAWRRKLGRRVGRSIARPVIRECDEYRTVGPHGSARQ
jgi:quinoprotein glucose dehydrogenase